MKSACAWAKLSASTRVAKHFELVIEDVAFVFRHTPAMYHSRKPRWMAFTSFAPRCRLTHMAAAGDVRNYKSLANVERAFRSFKPSTLKVRRFITVWLIGYASHIFLCMLAYYVEVAHARSLAWSSAFRRCRPGARRQALTQVARDTL